MPSTGHRSLLRATREGDLPKVKELLAAGCRTGLVDNVGRSALHIAAAEGRVEILRPLIAAGADLEQRDVGRCSDTADTPGTSTALHLAAAAGHLPCVAALLAAGADMEAHTCTCKGLRALHLAARDGREDVLQLLLDAGADVDAEGQWGLRPLHWAARLGHAACVERLLAAGAAVDVPMGGAGGTPLREAAVDGSVACVRALLAAGADPNIGDAARSETPLHVASYQGHPEVVQELLGHSAAVDLQNIDASTALDMAAFRGHPRCVELLLAAGADTSNRNRFGDAPLDSALREKKLDCAMALLASGRTDPNAISGRGWHPLDLAGRCGAALQPEHLRALLDAGADMALACKPSMLTPLDELLLSCGAPTNAPPQLPELIRIMVAAGCPVNRPGTRVGGGHGQEPLSTAHWWLLLLAGAQEAEESEWEEVESEGSGDEEDKGQGEGQEPVQGVVPWLAPPSGVLLAVSRELLTAAAAQRPKGRPELLAHAVAAGSPELVRMVLALFPSMAAPSRRQRGAGASAVQAALGALAGALCRLPPPAQAEWSPQEAGPVVRLCEIAEALLAAGCPPVPVRDVMPAVEEAGLPDWAEEPLSQLLPMVASGRADWRPERHAAFPPAFRAAARTLLLINDCRGFGLAANKAGRAAGGGPGNDSSPGPPSSFLESPGIQAPPAVMHSILGLAARPITAWIPQLCGAPSA